MHNEQNYTFTLIGLSTKKRKLDGNDTRTKLTSNSKYKAESQSKMTDSFSGTYFI